MLSFRDSAPDTISAPEGHARHKRTWVIRPADRDRLRINPEPALNQGSVRLLTRSQTKSVSAPIARPGQRRAGLAQHGGARSGV